MLTWYDRLDTRNAAQFARYTQNLLLLLLLLSVWRLCLSCLQDALGTEFHFSEVVVFSFLPLHFKAVNQVGQQCNSHALVDKLGLRRIRKRKMNFVACHVSYPEAVSSNECGHEHTRSL